MPVAENRAFRVARCAPRGPVRTHTSSLPSVPAAKTTWPPTSACRAANRKDCPLGRRTSSSSRSAFHHANNVRSTASASFRGDGRCSMVRSYRAPTWRAGTGKRRPVAVQQWGTPLWRCPHGSSSPAHGDRQREQRFSEPSTKKKETQRDSATRRCRCCRAPAERPPAATRRRPVPAHPVYRRPRPPLRAALLRAERHSGPLRGSRRRRCLGAARSPLPPLADAARATRPWCSAVRVPPRRGGAPRRCPSSGWSGAANTPTARSSGTKISGVL